MSDEWAKNTKCHILRIEPKTIGVAEFTVSAVMEHRQIANRC